jgi:hypothetical protein
MLFFFFLVPDHNSSVLNEWGVMSFFVPECNRQSSVVSTLSRGQ